MKTKGRLYQELKDYIFRYCVEYYTVNESKAYEHHFGTVKFGHWSNENEKIRQVKKRFISEEEDVLNLLKGGFEKFADNTATRIYNEHKEELNLNLCPNCNKIARTPKAKQCRFCSHNWH